MYGRLPAKDLYLRFFFAHQPDPAFFEKVVSSTFLSGGHHLAPRTFAPVDLARERALCKHEVMRT
jgi:hypothetical protein